MAEATAALEAQEAAQATMRADLNSDREALQQELTLAKTFAEKLGMTFVTRLSWDKIYSAVTAVNVVAHRMEIVGGFAKFDPVPFRSFSGVITF